jgi:hypothetical protein
VSTVKLASGEQGFYLDEITWQMIALPNETDARDFLGAMNEIPWQTGGFRRALVEAALVADPMNRRKLRVQFGGIISAVILYKECDEGFAELFRIAGYPVPAGLERTNDE